MAHPVLEQQQVMMGGVSNATQAPPEDTNLSFSEFDSEFLSKRIPNTVAAMVLGSVITLLALRMAGFRFSFGVNVGGGG